MKKILMLSAFLVFFTCCVTAQYIEGSITYEIKTNMHRRLPEGRQQMKDMVPESNISSAQLWFNVEESFFKPLEDDPEPEAGAQQRRIHIRRPRNEIYLHASESKRIELREFMGKKYLIEDTIRMQPWKIESEEMEIQGYACRKATLFDELRKANIVAWYCSAFRPFLGPENFNSLPGAVLMVDINQGERIITAKTIDIRAVNKNELKIPAGKIKVTEQEYQEIVKEQMERMRANGGNMMIRN